MFGIFGAGAFCYQNYRNQVAAAKLQKLQEEESKEQELQRKITDRVRSIIEIQAAVEAVNDAYKNLWDHEKRAVKVFELQVAMIRAGVKIPEGAEFPDLLKLSRKLFPETNLAYTEDETEIKRRIEYYAKRTEQSPDSNQPELYGTIQNFI